MTAWKTLTLPMPPSDNKIYFSRGRARILTTAATKFQKQVADIIATEALSGTLEDLNDHSMYAITITIYFKEVETKGWPDKAKNKFHKLDCTNRQKLVIDSIMKCFGVDDRTIFDQRIIKMRDPHNPRVEVELRRM
jgi:Holliday junction resolvase RusA-like endonuclease